jgi:hypothetical protein
VPLTSTIFSAPRHHYGAYRARRIVAILAILHGADSTDQLHDTTDLASETVSNDRSVAFGSSHTTRDQNEVRRMHHTPDLHRRLAWLSPQNDAVRGGLCAILLLALAVWGLPLWLTLILPFSIP